MTAYTSLWIESDRNAIFQIRCFYGYNSVVRLCEVSITYVDMRICVNLCQNSVDLGMDASHPRIEWNVEQWDRSEFCINAVRAPALCKILNPSEQIVWSRLFAFMSYCTPSGNSSLPAPCIVDSGIVINKQDIQRLVTDLGRVRYIYRQGDDILSEGEGHILEVFADAQQSTLVTNASLYINVCSFDYLELRRSPDGEAQFDLVQDNRQLSLIPRSNPIKNQSDRAMNVAAIEAMVAEVLSANIDMRLDDSDQFSF